VADAAARLIPVVGDRIAVIHTGLPVPELMPADPPVQPRLVCLGRLVRDKGFDVALKAFRDLIRVFPDVRLTIAGDGPESGELQRLTGELDLRDVVDFTGWVAPDHVPHLLNQATAVLMPSRREGMPLVAIQAAQMGRPVVAARTGGLPEVVVDGGTGLLVEPDDPAALRDATVSLLSTPELVEKMGTAARARARELFSRERSASLYHSVYQRLAATPRAAR
jgi:glycogen(starch) synthase